MDRKPNFRKFKTRFPVARIKKIMRADEDVGKVSQGVPFSLTQAKAVEMFLQSLVEASCKFAQEAQDKKLQPKHIKDAINKDTKFDFLQDIADKIPEATDEPEKKQRKKKEKIEENN